MSCTLHDGRAAGERTDHDAGQDVADDQRLPEPLREEAAREGGEQHEGEVGDEGHSEQGIRGGCSQQIGLRMPLASVSSLLDLAATGGEIVRATLPAIDTVGASMSVSP